MGTLDGKNTIVYDGSLVKILDETPEDKPLTLLGFRNALTHGIEKCDFLFHAIPSRHKGIVTFPDKPSNENNLLVVPVYRSFEEMVSCIGSRNIGEFTKHLQTMDVYCLPMKGNTQFFETLPLMRISLVGGSLRRESLDKLNDGAVRLNDWGYSREELSDLEVFYRRRDDLDRAFGFRV